MLDTVRAADPQLTIDPSVVTARDGTVAIGMIRSYRPEDPDPRVERSYLGTELLVSRDGAPFSKLVECEQGRDYPLAALAGGGLVSIVPGCGWLTLRPTPDAPPEALAGDARRLAAGGDFVAWLDRPRPAANPSFLTGDVVVYDVRRRALVRRVAAADLPGGVNTIDVAGDGSLAVAFVRGRKRAGVAVAPVGGRLRVLPLPRGERYSAQIAGGRIVARRSDSEGRSELRSIRPTARSSRLLARRVGGFDFDGRTVAWVTARCGRSILRTSSLRPLFQRPATPRRCQWE
jgi:hypothetical protein